MKEPDPDTRSGTAVTAPLAKTVSTAHGSRPTAQATRAAPHRRHAATPPPLILDRYRLSRQLGAGAFGTVWMARDERLERDVAVKIVPRERIVGGRFEREARAAARLSHPGIVTLYEAGADDDGAYLVSELVRGSTLGDLLEAGRLSDREIIAIGVGLSDALTHAHDADVVHRDVKPSNVLVPDRPPSPASVAKLTDFGVARIVGGDTLTRTGDVVGTAAYMAPEQAEGRDAGPEADLYALALVLYEALSGVNPIRTGTAAQRARRLGAHLPPLRRQRRDLPRELGHAIDLALSPRPRDRGTIADLRATLAATIDRASDVQGVVAPAWEPRPAGPEPARALDPPARPFDPPAALDSPRAHSAPALDPPLPPDQQPTTTTRALAALASAVLTAWLITTLLPNPPLAPLAAALVAALATVAAPRAGWFLVAAALGVWLSLAGQTGAALAITLAAFLPAALAPRRGTAWPLSAAAPVLGAIGLAGAWPALAGRARGPLTRAALGATGFAWTLVAGALTGHNLYLRVAPGAPIPSRWTPSASAALQHVLAPLVTSGALAPALVWAAAAVVLPWIVRGSSPALDFVSAAVWAAALVAGTTAALRTARGSLGGVTLHGAVLGGVVAFVLALAPSLWRAARASRAGGRVPKHPGRPQGLPMSVLRSLESKIAGLVEGTFNRAFRTEVRPVEIARRLAREMEEHKSHSLSATYVPNEYVVYLSPRDRDRFGDYEQALGGELSGYLLEFARRERLALLARPVIEFATDDRLGLGEFGIHTRMVQQPEAPAYPDEAEERDYGRTMIRSSAERLAEPLEERAQTYQSTALLMAEGKRIVVGPGGATIGRSRQCDVVLTDPNVSRRHAELRPRGGSWVLSDLGATNGVTLNGRRIEGPEVVRPGDRIELGTSVLTFGLE